MKIVSRPKIQEPSQQDIADQKLAIVEKAFEALSNYENARTILDSSRGNDRIITPTNLVEYERMINLTLRVLHCAGIIGYGFQVHDPVEIAGSTYEEEKWLVRIKFLISDQAYVADLRFVYRR